MEELAVVVVCAAVEQRQTLSWSLEEEGFSVHACGDAFLGLGLVREVLPDVVIAEHDLPGMLGLEFVRRVREFSIVPIIAMSSRSSVALCDELHRAGVQRFLDTAEAESVIGRVAAELLAAPRPEDDFMTVDRARQRTAEDEKRWYSSLVAAFGGNISAIARHLDVDRSTVQYHLARLGLR